jgi:hypothetical protein
MEISPDGWENMPAKPGNYLFKYNFSENKKWKSSFNFAFKAELKKNPFVALFIAMVFLTGIIAIFIRYFEV